MADNTPTPNSAPGTTTTDPSVMAANRASLVADSGGTLKDNGGNVVPINPPSPIAADTLTAPVKPVTVPAAAPTMPATPPVVPVPQGTTVDANGNATVTPPATPPANGSSSDTQSWIKQQLSSLGGILGTKSAVTQDLQSQYGLAQKTQDAATAYSTYNQAKLDLAQKIESMKENNPTGQFGSDVQGEIARVEREGNANVANLAVAAQAAQGLMDAAQKTIDEKITAQFQPVQDQVDFLTKFSQVNSNDLTESQKIELQAKIDAQKSALTNVQTAASDIHQTLLKNNASPAAYDAVDKVVNDYINGKVDASTAQSQMYAAAARYGSNASNYVVGANPVVDAHIQDILNGNETMGQVPSNLRNAVAVGMNQMPAGAYSPLAASRFTIASSRITNQFTNLAAYKLVADGQPYLERIASAANTPGSVADQDLLDSYTKLNSSGNAVTDSQISVITGGKSIADWANTLKNQLANGGVLSDKQRQDIQTIAKNTFANYQKGYAPIYKQAETQLTAAGIPKAFWTIPDLNSFSMQAGTGNAAGNQPQNTTLMTGPDNNKYYVPNDQVDAFVKAGGKK